ncbi:MucR family transcriptional regulator [Blastococcus sp. SYSU DS1024]
MRNEPHVPIGRLDDGTPVYAPPGRLLAVDGQRRVRCHACGALLAHISADHVRRHGLTPDGYRSRFGLPPGASLTAPSVVAAKAVDGKARYVANGGHAGLANAWVRLATDAHTAHLTRAAELGFPGDLSGYLRDRHVARGLGVGPIAAELGASRRTVRRLLDEAGVPRQTSLTRATAADARLARVAELGFPGDLPGYLRQRYVTDNRGLVAIARELRTSVPTVQALLDEAGVPRRRPGWPPPPRKDMRG